MSTGERLGIRWFIARSTWLASLLLVPIICLLPAGTSLAVTPLPGQAYAGGAYDDDTEPLTQASARLVVSRSGRTLVPRRGSFVVAHAPCGRDKSANGAGAKVRLTERFRIRADGSFRIVERHGDTRLWAHGRFTRRWAARLFVVLRTPPPEPRNRAHPGFCTVRAPGALRLTHYGAVPFRDCRTHPAATVAESADARVFAHRFYGPTRWYGCLFDVNLQVLLGSTSEEGIGGPGVFRLAGPYAGYVRVGCSAGCGYHVGIKDLRDGNERPGACCWLGVFDLVMNANATFAFIEDPQGDPPPEVRVKDGDFATIFGVPTRVLDSGTGIDNRSLALNGNTLSWLHDGAWRTAPLE